MIIPLQAVADEHTFHELNLKKTNIKHVIYFKLRDFNYKNKFLIYVHNIKTLYLCKYIEDIKYEALDDGIINLGNHQLIGNYSNKDFAKYKILDKTVLSKKIKFPETDKTYFLEKPIHDKLLTELIYLTEASLEISDFLTIDKNRDTGCIAYKDKNTWGFLYYNRQANGEYGFKFEKVDNYFDNIKLTQSEEGFKDFTYFIKSHALPKAYKIGRAENPDKRLQQIQAHNARNVSICLVLADGRLETYYHNKFDYLRISDSREWFELEDEITAFIEQENVHRKYIINIFKKSRKK